MNVFDRFEMIKSAFGIKNDSALAVRLDISHAYFSRLKRGLVPLNEKAISNFLTRLPGLSESFIRDGIGDPIDPNRQAEIDREALISMILRNFNRLEPAAQSVILETARRLAESADKKNDRPDESDGLPPAVRAG